MKKLFFLTILIGMISIISPYQGEAQNPWNYKRTIRITGDLVEVFEDDQPNVLLDSYTGPVKGTSIWANLLPVNPSQLEGTRFMAKNGQTFWIDMNEIQELTNVTGIGGTDPATLHENNMIEVWGAGMLSYYYTAAGNNYYVFADVNHFGVTQWAGADLPSETIRVVVDGSPLNGTLAPDGAIYLAENEVIGVPEWPSDVVGFYDYRNGNYIPLIEYQRTAIVGELLDLANIGGYGASFVLSVAFSDGTSNGPQYCNSMEYFTVIDNRQETILVESIILTPSNATLIRGEQLQFTATVLPSNATNPDLFWSSSDPEVAVVSQTGLVNALFPGTTVIRATAQDGSGVFGEATLTVVLPEYQLIFSAGIGGNISATVDGQAITSPAILEEGTIVNFTAIPQSNYVLEAWYLDGIVMDTLNLNFQLEMLQNHEVLVTFKLGVILVEEVILTPSNATLIRGEQLQLTANVLPENATNQNLVWTSNNPGIATVSPNGLVTTWSPGIATIRATAQDGSGVFGEATLTVVLPEYQLIFSAGIGGNISATVDGQAITSPAILEEGTIVNFTAIPQSNYVLEAWYLDGIVMDTLNLNFQLEMLQSHEVLVTFKLDIVGIEEIILSPTKAILIKQEQIQLIATVLPSNTTNPDLVWSSSDGEIAMVDESGLVTAYRPGKSLILAGAADGSGVYSNPVLIIVREISPFSSQRSFYIEIEDLLGRKVPSKGYPSVRMIKKRVYR